jgi:hypothetical protein
MLNLLPALLLLLLNGPANIERMAEGGALPAALASIQQRIDSPDRQVSAAARADQMALASLLSMSGDPRMSQALARIFCLNIVCEPVPSAKPEKLLDEESGSEPPPVVRVDGQPRDGFLDSQRSRDGPAC